MTTANTCNETQKTSTLSIQDTHYGIVTKRQCKSTSKSTLDTLKGMVLPLEQQLSSHKASTEAAHTAAVGEEDL